MTFTSYVSVIYTVKKVSDIPAGDGKIANLFYSVWRTGTKKSMVKIWGQKKRKKQYDNLFCYEEEKKNNKKFAATAAETLI